MIWIYFFTYKHGLITIRCGFAIITNVQGYIVRFNERFNDFKDTEFLFEYPLETSDENTDAGRLGFLMPQEQLEGLRSLHFSRNKITHLQGVSERTIR